MLLGRYPLRGFSLNEFYDQMDVIKASHGQIQLYPSRDEVLQEELKMGDIRTLDSIAQRSDPEFAWRPKTCFGGGPCNLELGLEDKMVLKRTFSCSGASRPS